MPQSPLKPLAVSMGEPAGVGPDIIIQTSLMRSELDLPPFYVLGDKDFLVTRAKKMGVDLEWHEFTRGDPFEFKKDKVLPILHCPLPGEVEPGCPNTECAAYTIELIRRAVLDIYDGFASGLVTAPIHKAALYRSGFEYPGHTEYLAALAEELFNQSCMPVMMLATNELRVVPATVHVPLKDVPALLSSKLLIDTARIVDHDLKRFFGIEAPKIIFTGLNPHAGEDGALGDEENSIISPAVVSLIREGVQISGPFSGDTCFHKDARRGYDAVIAMYHDQALIPIKTLDFDRGVNVTLGLPFVRTSPDHGTALDIAGSGKARPTSFIEALKLASTCAGHFLDQTNV